MDLNYIIFHSLHHVYLFPQSSRWIDIHLKPAAASFFHNILESNSRTVNSRIKWFWRPKMGILYLYGFSCGKRHV